jgi:parallel beta-helix repeat protein
MKTIFKWTPLFSVFILSGLLFSCDTAPETEQDQIHYGPVDMVYDEPEVPGTIYYAAPDGDAASDGLAANTPTSIENAISNADGGDAVVMRGGIYRTGNLEFNQGITIQAYRDENPVLNGTLVAESWSQVEDSLWATDWDYLFPAGTEVWWNRERNEEHTPMHRFNNDGVFVDGQFLQSAGNTEEVDEGTFFVDYDENKIYIGTNPEGKLIEITAFRKSLLRVIEPVNGKIPDDRGPVIRGITFTQYADTMVHIGGGGLTIDQHGSDAVGTVFENCTFSNNFRIAMFALSDSLVMRNCNFVNTNTEGVYIVASDDILLERNIFENNNIENWTGFFPSAVKIFNQSHRAMVRENLVINQPNSNGVWWDVGNHDGAFINNHVEGVDHSGFFFEISDGCTVAGNVFKDCDQGVFVLNSSNVEVYNNTLINSMMNFRRTDRGDKIGTFGWHVTTGPGVEERDGHVVMNNLLYMGEDNDSPMVHTEQPADMCDRLDQPHFKAFDSNVFVREVKDGEKHPVIRWSPFENEDCGADLYTPGELNELVAEFSAKGEYYENYEGQIFVDVDNDNYELVEGFPGKNAATTMPSQVAGFLGVDAENATFIGAIPY